MGACVRVWLNMTECVLSCVHVCVNLEQLLGHTLSMIYFVKQQLLSLESVAH